MTQRGVVVKRGKSVERQEKKSREPSESTARDASGEFPQFFMAAPEKFVGGELLEILEA